MRASGLITLALAAITGLIIADMFAHPQTTQKLIGAGTTESRLIAGK
jgi:hypothetical protein